ncbi:protein kinase [Phenylobacterium sp. LjRoot225]|uniref:protein kinase n=1 Tax=Phenylobacterium sp. LjRoot225 TaxID=3342285 RepID=UPI003ECFEE41
MTTALPTPAAMAKAGLRLERHLQRRPLTDCYLGRHEASDTAVFVKVLHAEAPGPVRNFQREIGCLSDLQGLAGTPRLLAHDVAATPMFHACALVRATPLPRYCAEAELEDILECASALANWISALHARGYAHRDLSPDHIFIGEDRNVTVVDFGLAKPNAAPLELGYDVQAFGMILWELVCGRTIFDYRSGTVAAQIAEERALIATLRLESGLSPLLADCLATPSEVLPESAAPGLDARALARRSLEVVPRLGERLGESARRHRALDQTPVH